MSAPARKNNRINRHTTAPTSAILPGDTRRIARHDGDDILIIAALLQRFSNPVFSCSNPIPKIPEQVQKDFQTNSFKKVSGGSPNTGI